MHILLVEDNPAAARLLHQAASEAGYIVETANNGDDALERASTVPFDLILLDVMLPGRDGLSVCRALRAASITTPVLMLTARDTLEDKIAGLDSGADDYLVKPFLLAELLARMRALLRRSNREGNGNGVVPTLLSVADLTLNTATRQAERGGKITPLSTTEYRLLEYLMRHAGTVQTRSALLEAVWQYDFGGQDNVLDVYISYLRGKVDRGYATSLIHTMRGVGYKISAPVSGG